MVMRQILRQQVVDLMDSAALLGRQAGSVLPGVGVQRRQMRRVRHRLLPGAGDLHRPLDDLMQQARHLRVRRPVVDLLADAAADDKAAVLQLAQMVGGGGAAHAHHGRQVHHAFLTVAQQPEDPHPAGVGQQAAQSCHRLKALRLLHAMLQAGQLLVVSVPVRQFHMIHSAHAPFQKSPVRQFFSPERQEWGKSR